MPSTHVRRFTESSRLGLVENTAFFDPASADAMFRLLFAASSRLVPPIRFLRKILYAHDQPTRSQPPPAEAEIF